MSNIASSRSHQTMAIPLHWTVEVQGQDDHAHTESYIRQHPISERAPIVFVQMATFLCYRHSVTWSVVKQVRDFVL